jgi:hypothetical protein
MSHKPTIHTYFDNREGLMILRESSRFFNCEYNPIYKDVRTAFLSELRSEVKKQERIDSKHTFLCGCCKRPLKIIGGQENGKKCFHFMHMFTPSENECEFFDKVPFSKEEIKAMVFNGRTESVLHKQTKNTISMALREEPDIIEVAVEEVAKRVGKTWRKPDIRADFNDKTVVFEVQLSPIFHHVILERNDAYRENGWYICWIFDDVNEDAPVMRELDAWVNNNYNLLGFDDEARAATEANGRLYLTVKYYTFTVIEDGPNSRLGGEWHTETVQFSDLTFDTNQRMVYLHNSNSEKQECLDRIQYIINDCNTQIEENKRKEEEFRRINDEKEDTLDFVSHISSHLFPSDMFWQVLKYLDSFNEEIIDVLLESIRSNIKTFEEDALNKWLKIVCEVVRLKGKGVQIGKELWIEVIYSHEFQWDKIKYVSLTDFFRVFGVYDYSRVLPLLRQAIDEETSMFLDNIKVGNENFVFYTPLLLLNRYYKVKNIIPERILKFFAERQKEIWCLVSAQQGLPFGYDMRNIRQIANLVWNSYPDIADLFLYLIRRNQFVDIVAEVKVKPGKTPVNHYQRLIECAERKIQTQDLTCEDLEILFPLKK